METEWGKKKLAEFQKQKIHLWNHIQKEKVFKATIDEQCRVPPKLLSIHKKEDDLTTKPPSTITGKDRQRLHLLRAQSRYLSFSTQQQKHVEALEKKWLSWLMNEAIYRWLQGPEWNSNTTSSTWETTSPPLSFDDDDDMAALSL
jgi:hypothetical protein